MKYIILKNKKQFNPNIQINTLFLKRKKNYSKFKQWKCHETMFNHRRFKNIWEKKQCTKEYKGKSAFHSILVHFKCGGKKEKKTN